MSLDLLPPSNSWLSQVKIRYLVKADLPALEWNGEFAHFRRLYQDIFQSFCKGKAVMWVAELTNVGIIGQVFVQLSSSRIELADGVNKAYVYGFRIQTAYRGHGLGTGMMRVVEEDLRRRRFKWVTLNVSIDNAGAKRLYEKLGYQVVASEPGKWSYKDEQGHTYQVHEPAWRMEKRLTE